MGSGRLRSKFIISSSAKWMGCYRNRSFGHLVSQTFSGAELSSGGVSVFAPRRNLMPASVSSASLMSKQCYELSFFEIFRGEKHGIVSFEMNYLQFHSNVGCVSFTDIFNGINSI